MSRSTSVSTSTVTEVTAHPLFRESAWDVFLGNGYYMSCIIIRAFHKFEYSPQSHTEYRENSTGLEGIKEKAYCIFIANKFSRQYNEKGTPIKLGSHTRWMDAQTHMHTALYLYPHVSELFS